MTNLYNEKMFTHTTKSGIEYTLLLEVLTNEKQKFN